MRLSRLLQIGLLLTFFLPFFRQCSPLTGQSEREIEIMRNEDSLKTVAFIDSIKSVNPNCNIDSALEARFNPYQTDSVKNDTLTIEKKGKSEDCIVYKWIKRILNPNDNISGVGYFVSTIVWIIYYGGTSLALILWIIASILKFKKRKLFHTINITGLILFFLTYIDKVHYEFKLWGYWVCFIWAILMIVLDLIIEIKDRKNRFLIDVR
jgi:hypothetical protein